jgi:nitrogen fixation NifU-like protein
MFEDLRDLYQDVILDRGRTPRHGQRLAVFDADAKGDNPMCGDRVHVFARHTDGRIAELGFAARGCAVSIASADLLAEAVIGLTDAEALAMGEAFGAMAKQGGSDDPSLAALQPLSGVAAYPSRIKCATLPWAALRAALTKAPGMEEGVASSE